MLLRTFTKRLVTYTRPFPGIGETDAAWTIDQLRQSAQLIADHTDELAGA